MTIQAPAPTGPAKVIASSMTTAQTMITSASTF